MFVLYFGILGITVAVTPCTLAAMGLSTCPMTFVLFFNQSTFAFKIGSAWSYPLYHSPIAITSLYCLSLLRQNLSTLHPAAFTIGSRNIPSLAKRDDSWLSDLQMARISSPVLLAEGQSLF
jgi:hypothetical protein